VNRALGRTLRSSSASSDLGGGDGPGPKGGRARILVVEDSETNCRLIARLLQNSGHACDVAADGAQAIDAVRSVPYDLVLMDVRMPNMDGYEATRTIRRELGPSPPVVALTADTSLEVRERCEAAGMNDFLAKPLDPAAFEDVLVRFLD
jgi:CheY-like chemotaxis protein